MQNTIKTPEENVKSLLTGKKVLFLENDNTLQDGVKCFYQILKKNKIASTVLYELSEVSLEEIARQINSHDAIVFQTTWLTESSKKLYEYVSKLQQKLIVIEVYVNEPTWYYSSQHGTQHDVFIFQGLEHIDLEFYKLTNNPYWDYKNKFDK